MAIGPHRPASTLDRPPETSAHNLASRALLTAWLLYSAIALGWFLANDPLLSLYVCGAP